MAHMPGSNLQKFVRFNTRLEPRKTFGVCKKARVRTMHGPFHGIGDFRTHDFGHIVGRRAGFGGTRH